MKKFFLILIAIYSILFIYGCDDDHDWHYRINVPFIETSTYVTAASSIAMWSAYDGFSVPEETIVNFILNPDGSVNHWYMELAIGEYTNSIGWMSEFPNTDNGQNMALSAVSSSLEHGCCSILPLINAHYVPVTRAEGHYNGALMVAEGIWFHAYDSPNMYLSSGELKHIFYMPINGSFIAFEGRRLYETRGLANYYLFKNSGGTYLGAPANYYPSNNPIN